MQRDRLLDLIVVCLTAVAGYCYCLGEEYADKRPVVKAVVYSQPDCAPCQRMKKQFAGSKLPVQFEERASELQRQKIASTPTTIIFVSGVAKDRRVGTITPAVMRKLLAAYDE